MNNFFFNNQYPDGFQINSGNENLFQNESQCPAINQFNQAKFPNGSPNHILNLKNTKIKEVWDFNFEEEIYKIMDLIEHYNVIAIVRISLKINL